MATERNPRVSRALTPPMTAKDTRGSTELADAAVAVGKFVSERKAEGLATDLQDELTAAHQEFVEEHSVIEDDPLIDLDPSSRGAVNTFMDIQARLQAAADQGTVPVTELKMRQERILREYMRRYPKLVPMFQQAATGVLGYNPIGAEIQHLSQQRQMRQSEAQAIYNRVISAADAAGVNPALQITDPAAYWDRALEALDHTDRNAKLGRSLKAEETLGTLSAISARKHIRANRGGMATGVWQKDVQPLVQEALRLQATMPPEQRRKAAESGMFDDIRAQIAVSKQQFRTEFYNEFFVNSDMTPEQLDAELRPVLAIYDYALENLGDEALMSKVNKLVEVQGSEFFLEYPQVQRLNLMADVLNSHAVASAIQSNRAIGTEISRILSPILNQTMGGRGVPGGHRTPSAFTPDGRVNPAAADGVLPPIDSYATPDEAVVAFDQHFAYMLGAHQIAGDEDADPRVRNEARTATAAMATQFANTYLDHYTSMNKLMPKDVVEQYIGVLADPNILPVWQSDVENPIDGVNRRKIVQAVGLMLESEQAATARDMRRILRDSLETAYNPMTGGAPIRLNDLVTPRWDATRNRPVYEMDEEAFEGLTSYGRNYKEKRELAAALERLNNSPEMAYLGRLAMASAHIVGSTRYAQAMDEEVLRILGFSLE